MKGRRQQSNNHLFFLTDDAERDQLVTERSQVWKPQTINRSNASSFFLSSHFDKLFLHLTDKNNKLFQFLSRICQTKITPPFKSGILWGCLGFTLFGTVARGAGSYVLAEIGRSLHYLSTGKWVGTRSYLYFPKQPARTHTSVFVDKRRRTEPKKKKKTPRVHYECFPGYFKLPWG